MKTLTQFDKQKIGYELARYERELERFNVAKYRWAKVLEALAQQDYDTSDFVSEAEESELLDFIGEFDIEQAKRAAAAKERFAMSDALRNAKREKRAVAK